MLEHELTSDGITVVVTCHGKCPELVISVHSLLFQENYVSQKPVSKNTTPIDIIISSDGQYEGPPEILKLPNVRLLENPKEGGVGHHTRGPGIDIAKKDWILLTNADNYYMAGWLDIITKQMTNDAGIIYWGHINSLGGYIYFETNINFGALDLGCLAVRTSVARKVGFPFRRYAGDWDYAQACLKACATLGLKVIRVPQILFVHN